MSVFPIGLKAMVLIDEYESETMELRIEQDGCNLTFTIRNATLAESAPGSQLIATINSTVLAETLATLLDRRRVKSFADHMTKTIKARAS